MTQRKGASNGGAYENDIETNDKLNVIRLEGKKRKKQTLGKRNMCCKLHTHTPNFIKLFTIVSTSE